jgi:hypothetical protein
MGPAYKANRISKMTAYVSSRRGKLKNVLTEIGIRMKPVWIIKIGRTIN